MHPLKKVYYFLAGYVYIDTSLYNNQTATLLHISDTPLRFFPALKRLIGELNPTYIVHTGDLVDNIKLHLYPGSIHRYNRSVQTLIQILENSQAKGIYLALGNHDSPENVKRFVKRSVVIDHVNTLQIENVPVRISHYPKAILEAPSTLNLFGHDLSLETKLENDQYFYNGILDINFIELDTLKAHTFPYPWGTDDDRLGKKRTSL